MADLQEWERQLQRDLDEVRRNSQQLSDSVAAIRGLCQLQGVAIEVDASGDITDLRIAPGALRWTSEQLAHSIRTAHRKARADAATKVQRLIQQGDPRMRRQFEILAGERSARPEPPRHQPMTEDDIQAADDAYFERMNRRGWTE